MKLVILNRYFHPDESATSRMASSLGFGLAERGWEVHAVSSRQLLGEPQANLPRRERIDGVTLHRIWTTCFGRRNILERPDIDLKNAAKALADGFCLVTV